MVRQVGRRELERAVRRKAHVSEYQCWRFARLRRRIRSMRDDDLRAVCFLALDALRAQHGDELPYAGLLDQGFRWRNGRVPFFNRQKGHLSSRTAVRAGCALGHDVRQLAVRRRGDTGRIPLRLSGRFRRRRRQPARCSRPTRSRSRSSTSSARRPADSSRCTRGTSLRTGLRSDASCSHRDAGLRWGRLGHWTTSSSDVTQSSSGACDYTSGDSEESSSRRTTTDARSARCARSGCSMPPTSLPTSRSTARQSCPTA